MFFHQFVLPPYLIQDSDGAEIERAKYRGPFIEEDSSCWAGEGAEVNYSITRWLSQELFKQAKASRGLGLITPAKVTPTTLSNRLLQCVCQTFRGIFISTEEGSI